MVWAGLAAGLATAFHIIDGGWGTLALFLAMLFNRRQFPLRRIGVFLLATAPFIVPLLLHVARFHAAGASGAEQARMDEIYVRFAMPECCDLDYFMWSTRWLRAAVVFAIAAIAVFAWPERREARILGAFVGALILFFAGAALAQRLELYGLLKLYPGQLAKSLPALFLFVFVMGWIGRGGPATRLGRLVGIGAVLGTLWLVTNREVARNLVRMPRHAIVQIAARQPRSQASAPLYVWIRSHTPANSVFVTPMMAGFWAYAERAQVASIRHPPLDRRILEWKARLEALNGFRPFRQRGFDIIDELNAGEASLSIEDLIRIRERYGATHYLTRSERSDLGGAFLHSAQGFFVYDLRHLASVPGAAGRRAGAAGALSS
jgi:hypothetical protein